MKRAIWIGVLAVLAFASILIVRLPASWFAGALPSDISCGQITGTVWNGGCGALAVRNAALGDLKWRLQPAGLLGRELVSQLALEGPTGSATALVAARSEEHITARNLRAKFSLNPALFTSLPP